MKQHRFRSWMAWLLAVMLVVLSVTPGFAETPATTTDPFITLLQEYQIVTGDENGNLMLDNQISRAELAKIVVGAKGDLALAPYLKDLVSFDDAKGHWSAGYVELALRNNLMKGRDSKHFDPTAPITYAEVYTVLLRLIEREPAGPWNPTAIMQAAQAAGLTPVGMSLDLIAGVPAVRGVIFRSLGIAISTVRLSDGKTVLQKHVDPNPPVLSVNIPPAASIQDSITITGTAQGASVVTVNGQNATLTGSQFSAQVSLSSGENIIRVIATDRAGNEATQTVTVTRGGTITRIDVTGPTQVQPGQSITVRATAVDANGNAFPASAVTAALSNTLGTYDVATGTFRAGNTAGVTTITFTAGTVTKTFDVAVLGAAADAASLRIRSINGGKAATAGKSVTVEVEVLNAEGTFLAYDQGRVVRLEAEGLTGITVTPTTATTVGGVATFTVASAQAGEVDLTAIAANVTEAVQSLTFATSTRIVLTATPESAKADGMTPVVIQAELQNEAGDPVTNTTGSDILIDLSDDSATSGIVSGSVVIRRNMSNSVGYNAQLIPGYITESVKVSGTIRSTHSYTVVPVTTRFEEIQIGSPVAFAISGGTGVYSSPLADGIDLSVRVIDAEGNQVTEGSYAFQVEVSTSNNDELVNGIPNGVSVTLLDGNEDTGLVPIKGATDAVIARTVEGIADLKLDYNRSGVVTVKIVGVGSTDHAFSHAGDEDKASSATTFQNAESDVRIAGVPAGLKAVVDLLGSKLEGQTMGVLPGNGSAQAIVKVFVVDEDGGWIPTAGGDVTLQKVTGTGTGTRIISGANRTESRATERAVGGVAEFTIAANSVADIDEWTASITTIDLLESEQPRVLIATAKEKPAKPMITSITGDESGLPNRITVADTHMDIQLASYPTEQYGFIKVYKASSTSAPIYTSDVMNLADGPYVRVPKNVLPDTADRYQVIVNNGYGDSLSRSDFWPADTAEKVVNETPLVIDISNLRYSADPGTETNPGPKLIAKAPGMTADGTIDASLLKLTNTITGTNQYLSAYGADCKPARDAFTCVLSELEADLFYGSVRLDAEDGWYAKTTGKTAVADEDTDDNYVYPMAYISSATVTFNTDANGHVTGTVTLTGRNLDKGKIYLDKLTFEGDSTLALGKAGETVTSTSPTSVTISIPDFYDLASADRTVAGEAAKSVAYRLKNNVTGPDVTIDAAQGWLKSTSSDVNGALAGIPVFKSIKITGITYNATDDTLTITGSGFEGATVHPEQLVIKNRAGALVMALTTADVVVEQTDTLISIKLATPGTLETATNRGNVYLSSNPTAFDPSGDVFWIQTDDDWYGVEIPGGRYRLTW